MKKFFALYMAPSEVIQEWMKTSSPEDMKKAMEDWGAWMKAHETIFSDQGAPLGKTKRVTKDGSTDVKNDVTGYSVVEADTHEAATHLFDGHPHLEIPGAYIDLLEVTSMSGM